MAVFAHIESTHHYCLFMFSCLGFLFKFAYPEKILKTFGYNIVIKDFKIQLEK